MSGGGVGRHGLVLESVGLHQLLLLLPALLLPGVVVIQLIQALRGETEGETGEEGEMEGETGEDRQVRTDR